MMSLQSNKPALLVTGGAGYIGSQLLFRALEAGYKVRILDGIDPGQDKLSELFRHPDVQFFRGSITDRSILGQCADGADYIVHLAGVSDGRAGKENPELTKKINSDSMEGLLEICKSAGIRKFLFASTFGVYGNRYSGKLEEHLQPQPVDPYSESKAIGESFVQAANTPDFCTISLRIAMVYGLGQKVREEFMLNRLCIDAARTGALRLMGGDQRRPQIHIDNLVGLFLHLLGPESPNLCGEVLNAVDASPTLGELAAAIQQALPQTQIEWLPGRPGEDSFELSDARLKSLTNYVPAVDLNTGIARIIDHYKTAVNI
jgi:nucleoside-diphosphate-sugar epimerase